MPTLEDLARLRHLRGLLVEQAIRDGVMQPPREWVPLPHQIPPEGDDWRGWLLMGGRGAGKTDAGARWVVDHVNGPPCLSGPTPHRIGILAPTQGDAATSCFEAPSGIYAHDPTAKLVTRQGGTVIMFANGSIAKLFGGSTPEEVERLRAGGNRSILAGTLIRAERGLVPIEQVQPGELVWTRLGLRPVVARWNNGLKPIWTLRTRSGRVLHLTADHPVWTTRGWVRCDRLSPCDTITSWNGAVTAGRSSDPTAHELSETETDTAPSFSTGRSTSSTSVRSLTGGMSTTRTTTRPTTTPPTWNADLQAHTTVSTRDHVSGTLRGAVRPSEALWSPDRASNADSLRRAVAERAFAARNAGANTRALLRPSCSHASCAAQISLCSGSPLPSHAHDVVETITPGTVEGTVWDLTVAGEHEFYANDLLVANCAFWIEELAAIRLLDQCFNHMLFGLRRTGTGPPPKWVASTTPKVRQLLKKMVNGDLPGKVVVTHATTYDNPHLQEQFRADLEAAYGGTTLGAQELLGQIIEEDENALWRREMILRADTAPDDLVRVSVGVDPSGGAGEQGIVVVGKQERTENGRKQVHGYVLGDYSCRLPPDGWGRRVVQAYLDFQADDIVVETNYGGDMAVSVIRGAADTMGVTVTIKTVTASRGKRVRAEPVAAMAAQKRWHHVGVFEELEAQMTQWTPESGYSPDRLDAMVWPAWHMKLVGTGTSNTVGSFGGSAMSRTRL